jgi:RHS repeat-associated protein
VLVWWAAPFDEWGIAAFAVLMVVQIIALCAQEHAIRRNSQRARLQGGGGLEGTEVFHYDGPGDSVAWTERGTSWTRNIAGLGGELAAVQESGTGVTLQLTDLHGDVVAAAEPSPSATKPKATYRFDEFGEPESGTAGRYGWLGGKSRRTELSSGVIQMGARSYIPQLGRFLTPDPVPGGSANPYDYANQDPVNLFDLNGEWPSFKKGSAAVKRAARQANKTGTIRIAIHTHQAAQRVEQYLSTKNATRWIENINLRAGEVKATQIYAVQKKSNMLRKRKHCSMPSQVWNIAGSRKGTHW